MVSVDVKHHVYLLTSWLQKSHTGVSEVQITSRWWKSVQNPGLKPVAYLLLLESVYRIFPPPPPPPPVHLGKKLIPFAHTFGRLTIFIENWVHSSWAPFQNNWPRFWVWVKRESTILIHKLFWYVITDETNPWSVRKLNPTFGNLSWKSAKDLKSCPLLISHIPCPVVTSY